jgi:Protein of unknown function (DUF3048) N-terminal domain/Protein of unknown function (DUF3048) C-terminal domain
MNKTFWIALIMTLVLSACGSNSLITQPTDVPTATPLPSSTPLPTQTFTPAATETPTATATPDYPVEGYGPSGFPADINPLTGLKVADPALLDRRPLAIKVPNLPRTVRPQWGLSLADIVYEYYTEEGSTRFIGIFLGNNAETVGPIRSARFFDGNIVRMYKAILAFGSGDQRVRNRLYSAEYAGRLVSEFPAKCPPMCRYEPNGVDYLITNTAELTKYGKAQGIDNGRQNLDGMVFNYEIPAGGQPVEHVFARFSGGVYNRWDYDSTTGKFFRNAETANSSNGASDEAYAPLTDRLTEQPISADNLVVVQVPHEYYSVVPEMVDMLFAGTGTAYIFRDGQAYKVKWSRPAFDSTLSLIGEDGKPFPFKPGNTWVEVMGKNSKVEQKDNDWRFTFSIP